MQNALPFLICLVPSWEDIHKHLEPAAAMPSGNSNEITIEHLMNAGLHLGHSTDIWHKNMLPFIYGRRAGIHIINLEHTLTYLRRALNVTHEVARRGGSILFVGMRPFLKEILINAANYSNQFYVHEKWLFGCLVNHEVTLRRATPNGMMVQPDLIVVLDMVESEICMQEALSAKIPTIGLCDTNCDPLMVTYPIPGNDDSHGSVEMIAYLLASAARDGLAERQRLRANWSVQQKQRRAKDGK